jgi:hypothetical protein
MLAVPAVPGGVVHVIDVADTTTTFVHAALPTVTAEAPVKFVPVIVIAVPPAVEPDVGLTEVTVGTGTDAAEYFRIFTVVIIEPLPKS